MYRSWFSISYTSLEHFLCIFTRHLSDISQTPNLYRTNDLLGLQVFLYKWLRITLQSVSTTSTSTTQQPNVNNPSITMDFKCATFTLDSVEMLTSKKNTKYLRLWGLEGDQLKRFLIFCPLMIEAAKTLSPGQTVKIYYSSQSGIAEKLFLQNKMFAINEMFKIQCDAQFQVNF